MRSQLREFYRPSEQEFQALWQSAVFAFDANVLLDVFRYSPSTTKQLLAVLEKLGNRVWIPYQAALEYQNNRHKVGAESLAAYETAIGQLDAALEALQRALKKNAESAQMLSGVIKSFQVTKKRLATTRDRHARLVPQEKLHDEISTLLEAKVGAPFSAIELAAKCILAESRIKEKTPPGYKDSGKNAPEKFGDTIIWFQLLDHAKAQQKPIIFVTGDAKDDWWWIEQGKTVGPRPELRREMYAAASVEFYMYPPERFLENARTYLGSKVSDDAISEAREIQSSARSGDRVVNFADLLGKSAVGSSSISQDILKYQAMLGTKSGSFGSLFGSHFPSSSLDQVSEIYRKHIELTGQNSAMAEAIRIAQFARPSTELYKSLYPQGLLGDALRRTRALGVAIPTGSVNEEEGMEDDARPHASSATANDERGSDDKEPTDPDE